MKIGTLVLCRKKDSDSAFEKRYIVDYLPSTKMVSFDCSQYSEAVYYYDIDDWEIKIIKGAK